MMSSPTSPRIEAVSWGKMTVEGLGGGGDRKLWPGGGRPWDWNETGTRHDPGIRAADLHELLDHGATVVVLGLGMHRALKATAEALALLRSRGVEVHADETRAAVQRYNALAEAGERVGALFHTTC